MAAEKEIKRMTPAEVESEAGRLKLERERLELEVLRVTVETQRAMKEQRDSQRVKQAEGIAAQQAQKKAEWSVCRHRTGGMAQANDVSVILKGKDDFSIIVNTYPWGDTVAMCTRCQKQWFPPLSLMQQLYEPKQHAAAKANKAELERQRAEYIHWLQVPTLSEPSGSQLFTFTKNESAEESAVAE